MHQSCTLEELVRAGADLNLQNEVRDSVAVDTAAIAAPCVPLCVSVLGGSDGSDDLSEEWEDRPHRYSTDRRQHRHRHSGERENNFTLTCIIEVESNNYIIIQNDEVRQK